MLPTYSNTLCMHVYNTSSNIIIQNILKKHLKYTFEIQANNQYRDFRYVTICLFYNKLLSDIAHQPSR